MTPSGTRPSSAPSHEAADAPASRPDRSLTIRVLPAADRDAAGRTWRAVEAMCEDDNPFAGWDWTETWLRHFGQVVEHEYLVAVRGGEPRGIALLTRSTRAHGPITLRRLHLGTAGEPRGESVTVEYNGLCAPKADRAAVAAAVVDHIRTLRGWDELHVEGFDPAHVAPLLAAEPGLVADPRSSPLLELDGADDDLVAALPSKSARATVRRSLRGITPYETELATDPQRALALLDDLERLHQARWQARGKPGAFASERFRGFHRELVGRWVPQGRAVLFAVRSGGETIAALYAFVRGDALQFYQGGFRIQENSKVRTGYAAHLLLAAAARERGLRAYEYLAGESRYKDELSTAQRSIVWASHQARTPRVMALRAGRLAAAAARTLPRRTGGDPAGATTG